MTAQPSLRPETIAVALGRPDEPGSPFNAPPTFASTFRDGGTYTYGRFGNPTWSAFEEVIGALEGGQALAFGSGQAAADAVLDSVPVGATVLVHDGAYLGTRGLLADLAGRHRLVVRTVDMTDTAATVSSLADADLVWIETPTNPLLGIVDLTATVDASNARRILSVVDNTFATPLLQRPLDLGATAVVASATKYIGGHSDLLLGVVITRDEQLLASMHARRTLHGGIPGSMETWLALRGLRTLPLRLERAQSNAGTLAARLSQHPAVTVTRYPGLVNHPGHALSTRQMQGPGAILAFDLPDAEAADDVVRRLRLIVAGTSLGGVETTIDRRNRWPGEERVPPGLLRLSVGIEHVEDLWDDLDQALKRQPI